MVSTIPSGSVTLHGHADDTAKRKPGLSSTILLRLDEEFFEELTKAAQAKNGLSFTTGKSPVCLHFQTNDRVRSLTLTYCRGCSLVARQWT